MSSAPLSFATLRKANLARLPLFKNRHGEPAHSEADGSDWTVADWMVATMGELGELCNRLKKVRRGDFTFDEQREEISREFADVVTYLCIAALRLGIDLGDATRSKWNEICALQRIPLRIVGDQLLPVRLTTVDGRMAPDGMRVCDNCDGKMMLGSPVQCVVCDSIGFVRWE